MADEKRTGRFLDLTGLSPEDLRERLGTAEVHLSVLDFLCAHEPDLIAAAEELGVPPGEIAAARQRLAS